MLLAGCGGSDDKKDAGTKAATPDQSAGQDADAKSNARNLVSYLESCYAGYGSYADCGIAEDGTVDGQDTGLSEQAAAGDLTTEVSTDGYTVTSTSESGNEFSVDKVGSGALERTCTTEGEGGCPDTGTW